jgi:hypothetical protein
MTTTRPSQRIEHSRHTHLLRCLGETVPVVTDKIEMLRQERGISFEEIIVAVEAGNLRDVLAHPHPRKYPRQKILVVEVAGCAHLVPCVEEDDHFFLKTITPSRKATRDFIAKESDDA